MELLTVRAERRIGELLERVPRVDPKDSGKIGGQIAGRGRAKGSGEAPRTLSSPLAEACERAAISPDMAKDCQKLAAIPAVMFEATAPETTTCASGF